MVEMVQLCMSLLTGVINALEDSPFMILIGLSIIAIIYTLILNSFRKGVKN